MITNMCLLLTQKTIATTTDFDMTKSNNNTSILKKVSDSTKSTNTVGVRFDIGKSRTNASRPHLSKDGKT